MTAAVTEGTASSVSKMLSPPESISHTSVIQACVGSS
eukprot:CAMPEP_0181337740 /NCGR_PEP_ID=MMETSP1101-20121128/28204_1 /TAXON_ID=46948 /ORGANISM="Rhodomonas abbreviata, Strain Caron Lab Isolate" /LENGTH=36 /DNA_ID= /DNA_START= /DNA_END= /DNA_ORIENTATION=